jgi:pentatricopeptide repeat protein
MRKTIALLHQLTRTQQRDVDIEGFFLALEMKDRVKGWLKCKDILLQEPQLLNKEHLTQVLRLLSTGSNTIPQMKLIMQHMKEHQMGLDTDIYNLFVKQSMYSNSFAVKQMLLEMNQAGFAPTIDTYNTILQSYFKQSKFEEGFDFLSRMIEEKREFNVQTFDIILSAAISSNKLDLGLEYVSQLEKTGLEYTAVTYLELIRLYTRLEQFEKSRQYFKIAKEKNLVDKFTCSAAIHSFTLSRDSSAVEDLLVYMDQNQIPKDPWFMQSLVKYYISIGNLDSSFAIFEELQNNYLDSVFLHTLVDGCFSCGKPEKAIELLELLHLRGTSVTLPMYRTILQGLRDSKRKEDALIVFDQIATRSDLIPAIYNIVLQACLEHYDLDNFNQIWSQLTRDPNCKPNVISYQLALDMYISVKDATNAVSIVERMQRERMYPSKEQLVQLISNCIKSRDFKRALWFMSLEKADPKTRNPQTLGKKKIPQTNFLESVVKDHMHDLENAIVKMDDWHLVREVYMLLFSPTENNSSTHVAKERTLSQFMTAFTKGNDLVRVVKVWNTLLTHYPSPHPKSTCALLDACYLLGQKKTTNAIYSLWQKQGWILDKEGYETLLKMLTRFTNCEAVPGLIIDMRNRNIDTSTTWDAIEEGFEKRKRDVSASRVGRNVDWNEYKAAQGKVYQFIEECFPEIIRIKE